MTTRATAIGCAVVALLLSGCGSDDERSSGRGAADLSVTVWARGPDGPAHRHRVVCPGDQGCEALSAARLRPTPANVACTEIYGGPAVARVRGTIDGKRVDVRLNRTNGCEIARWQRNAALLRAG